MTMGAFCVFGISRTVCQAAAAKKTPTQDGKRNLTPVEWAARRDELAEQMFNQGGRRVKISPELDAPHFCRDWIAADPAHVRDTVLMVRGPKRDKHGNEVLKNGAPAETWLPYVDECKRLGIPVAA
jgi:adenylate kinase family enzyme